MMEAVLVLGHPGLGQILCQQARGQWLVSDVFCAEENAAPKGTIEKQEIVHFGQHDFGGVLGGCQQCVLTWE